jgi:hypothetical protein
MPARHHRNPHRGGNPASRWRVSSGFSSIRSLGRAGTPQGSRSGITLSLAADQGRPPRLAAADGSHLPPVLARGAGCAVVYVLGLCPGLREQGGGLHIRHPLQRCVRHAIPDYSIWNPASPHWRTRRKEHESFSRSRRFFLNPCAHEELRCERAQVVAGDEPRSGIEPRDPFKSGKPRLPPAVRRLLVR